MSRIFTALLFLLLNLSAAALCRVALAAERQLEFGGVKLGSRADSLGIKLDDYRAYYRYKNKYYLSGYVAQPGHPISMIELSCEDANTSDEVGGIGCDDAIENITKKFGSVLFEMCSNYEVMSRVDESRSFAYYNPKTNQFWSFHPETKKISGIGIALSERGDWQKCKKPFTSSELSRVRLGLSASQLLGADFDDNNKRNDRYGLTESMFIQYDIKKSDFPITEIIYDCGSKGEVPRFKIRSFSCGDKAEDILGSLKQEIEFICSPVSFDGTQRVWRYYIPKTKEYWSFDDRMKVSSFGFVENKEPNSQPCDPAKVKMAGLLGDVKTAVKNVSYPEDKWELILTKSNYTIQIDSKSIKKKGHSYKIWTYTRYNRPVCYEFCGNYKVDGNYFTSLKQYLEFNCEDEQYRNLAYEAFDNDNLKNWPWYANKHLTNDSERKLVASGDHIEGWRAIVDDDMQLIAKRLCR